jgi:hypothetical protein
MERKLVTIRTVGDLTPIEGADLIQTAHVDGWSIVVKKGEFHAEEDILMFEVDSFLPIDDRYEFLRKGCLKVQEGKEG